MRSHPTTAQDLPMAFHSLGIISILKTVLMITANKLCPLVPHHLAPAPLSDLRFPLPQWSFCCSLKMSSSFPPQDVCSCYSLCLECHSYPSCFALLEPSFHSSLCSIVSPSEKPSLTTVSQIAPSPSLFQPLPLLISLFKYFY